MRIASFTGRILAGHCCIGTQRLKQRAAKISEPFMFNVFKMCKENHLRFLMNFTEALQNEQHIHEGFGRCDSELYPFKMMQLFTVT